jgi:nuclear pore complex protein Nup188
MRKKRRTRRKMIFLFPLSSSSSALDAAREIIISWKELWGANPLLLACVFRFLDAVRQRALEHKAVLDSIRRDPDFWTTIAAVACEEVGFVVG